jgi:diphosphomevalonate decarboxylase
VPAGFVEWYAAADDASSYAVSVAPPEHWALVDVIAVVSEGHKAVGSTEGHASARTSPLQPARVADAARRFGECRAALLSRDFERFARVVEQDSNLMHAVMMTSTPPLLYWQPGSIEIMHLVQQWRGQGRGVCYTLDAGPNVHCICLASDAEWVRNAISGLSCVKQVLSAAPGGAAHVVERS